METAASGLLLQLSFLLSVMLRREINRTIVASKLCLSSALSE